MYVPLAVVGAPLISNGNANLQAQPCLAVSFIYSRVNCVPNTFQPIRDPSTGWWCHSTGAGGASQYKDLCLAEISWEHISRVTGVGTIS